VAIKNDGVVWHEVCLVRGSRSLTVSGVIYTVIGRGIPQLKWIDTVQAEAANVIAVLLRVGSALTVACQSSRARSFIRVGSYFSTGNFASHSIADVLSGAPVKFSPLGIISSIKRLIIGPYHSRDEPARALHCSRLV
jgi:hypothetical protein